MSEENKEKVVDQATESAEKPEAKPEAAPAAEAPAKDAEPKAEDKKAEDKPARNERGDRRGGNNRGGNGRGGRDDRRGRGRGRGRRRDDKPQDEFESLIVDLARVTRVMAGGKRMRFRACVVVGDKKGRIAMAVKKGADVQTAVQKATDYAKKHLITVPVVEGTIPHTVVQKYKGAKVLLKPAKAGTGIIAGGPVRVVMDLAGVQNIVAKMQGNSKNKVNNVAAVVEALGSLRTKEDINKTTAK